MAHLVRPHQVRYVDREGRRVPRGTKGARKVKEKASKWYGCGIPGQGKKRVPLATDKESAQRMLDDLVKAVEQGGAKLPDRDAARRSLKEHLAEFETAVALGLAGGRKGRRAPPKLDSVKLAAQRMRNVLDGCDFRTPADLNETAPAKLAKYLHSRLAKTGVRGGASAQTADFLLATSRRFARWMAKKRVGVAPDLFDDIPGFDATNNRVHARRDVSPEELARILDVARTSGELFRGHVAGVDRHHIYLVAFATGFRAGELGALTPGHFHLAEDPPSVSLPGKVAKNKKSVRLPLNPGVAIALRPYFAGRASDRVIWPGNWKRHAAEMLRMDLAAAGVPYRVKGHNGPEFADFHALRHTFVSALAAAGTGPKELQVLARHHNPTLTLGTYTHARSAELVRAVGRLQVPGAPPPSPLALLDREQLEAITLSLLVMLGTILTPPAGQGSDSRVALRVAPITGAAGNSRGLLDTKARKRKRLP